LQPGITTRKVFELRLLHLQVPDFNMNVLRLCSVLLLCASGLCAAVDRRHLTNVCAEGTSQTMDSCFLLDTERRYTWDEAREACSEVGMQLASVHSPWENDFIVELAAKTSPNGAYLWLGLGQWVDGTLFDFQSWKYNDDEQSAGCAAIWTYDQSQWSTDTNNGKWSRYSCGEKLGVVCRASVQELAVQRQAGVQFSVEKLREAAAQASS